MRQLELCIANYWNATRTDLIAEWSTYSYYPTLYPNEITTVGSVGTIVESPNVQWGPLFAPTMKNPTIELYWVGSGEIKKYLSDQVRIAWNVSTVAFFREPRTPEEINVLLSRYSNLLFRTIRKNFNYDASGDILNASLTGAEPVATQREDEGVVEAAAVLHWDLWAQHNNHRP